MTFAIVDREREGIGSVLMLVDEKREAEEIAIELRRAGVRAEALGAEAVRGGDGTGPPGPSRHDLIAHTGRVRCCPARLGATAHREASSVALGGRDSPQPACSAPGPVELRVPR